MASAGGMRTFDVNLFRKLVRLFDSDREGERNTAFVQATHLCEQCQPRKLFAEAAAEAFGQSSSNSAEVAELQQKVLQRESEAAQLAAKYMEAQRRIEQLMQIREKQRRKIHSFGDLWQHAWGLRQVRLMMVVLALVFRVLCLWRENDAAEPLLFWVLNIGVCALVLRPFCGWVALEMEEEGLLQLLLKGTVLVAGIIWSFDLLVGLLPWQGGIVRDRFMTHMLLAPLPAIEILCGSGILAISKFSTWAIDTVGTRIWESRSMQFVRGCF